MSPSPLAALAGAPPISPYDESDIARCLSHRTAELGLDYNLDGRVGEIVVDPQGRHLWTTVVGSRRRPYQVMVTLAPGPPVHLTGRCSCPVGSNCKHAAAVLYAALDRFDLGATAARDPLAGPPADWLRRLQDSVAAAADPSESAERILYVLDVQPYGPGLTASLIAQVAKPKKSGGWSRLRTVGFDTLCHSSAAYLQPADNGIARLMIAGTGGYSTHLPRDAMLLDLLLRSVLDSGRCHWRSEVKPLMLGPTRRGTIAWRLSTDGRQRLVVAAGDPGVVVLAGSAPWYVDAISGEAGPLGLDIPTKKLEALLQAPLLSPAQAQAIRDRLAGDLAHLGLPAPIVDVQEEIRTGAPKPTLRLRSIRDNRFGWYMQGGQRIANIIDFAQLNFLYDGQPLRWQSAPKETRRLEGDRIIVNRRDETGERAAIERLTALGFAAGRQLQGVKGNDGMVLVPDGQRLDWPTFVHRHLPELQAEGWHIAIDEGFRTKVVEAAGNWLVQIEDRGAWWFSLELGVEVEGERLPLLPLLVNLLRRLREPYAPKSIDQLARAGVLYLPLPDGRHVALPIERVRAIVGALIELHDDKVLRGDGRLDVSLGEAAGLAELESILRLRWLGGERLRALAERLRSFAGVTQVPVPAGLAAELRPYQREGLDWLQFLSRYELGGILADDMGLGKTVQTLAHILAERRSGRLDRPCLVICPTSVAPNWRAEAARFAPDLRVLYLHGLDRAKRFDDIPQSDLVLTTYALLPRDEKVLLDREWHLVVADESQAIKNAAAKTTQLVCRLKARHRLSLTGTPIENHLGELWSQFAFLMPGMLGDSKRFNRVFRTPIEKHGDEQRRGVLATRLRPFLLRRTKAQVASELPLKSEIVQRVELGEAQRDLYETVRLAMHEKIRAEIAAKGLGRSHIVILDALLKLRQACCDPRLVKIAAARRVKGSAKLDQLLTMLPELIEEGRRILLFSQFTSMLDLVKPELESREIRYVELRGDTRDRATPVTRFQACEVPLFLISLKAGGTGLNLTAADAVIHYDPWWNPAAENQATDRAHRIGQDKPVFVFKLIARGTVEERILELQQRKAALAAALLDAEKAGMAGLTSEDLDILFRPID
jgi:superfamily II DNA or RNA helicase